MKKLVLAVALMNLFACGSNEIVTRPGKDGINGSNGVDGKDGVNGADGQDGVDGKDYQAPATLAGYHLLPDGGYLELLEDADHRIVINSTQRVYTRNTDISIGLFGALAAGPHVQHDGVIRIEATFNYVAATNNVQIDSTTTPIVGNRKTVTTLSLNADKKLVINVLVYAASGLSIEATRTVTAQ